MEGLHTKVNREVQVACRVSMIHWRRALAGFHNHEVQAPFGTDNSITNPQNACRRLTLPPHHYTHLLTTRAYPRTQIYVLM